MNRIQHYRWRTRSRSAILSEDPKPYPVSAPPPRGASRADLDPAARWLGLWKHYAILRHQTDTRRSGCACGGRTACLLCRAEEAGKQSALENGSSRCIVIALTEHGLNPWDIDQFVTAGREFESKFQLLRGAHLSLSKGPTGGPCGRSPHFERRL